MNVEYDEDEGGAGVEDIGRYGNDVGGEELGEPDQQEAPRTLPIEGQNLVKRKSKFDDDE
jgi:hypothetical protein